MFTFQKHFHTFVTESLTNDNLIHIDVPHTILGLKNIKKWVKIHVFVKNTGTLEKALKLLFIRERLALK
jgi:hypothetical protein